MQAQTGVDVGRDQNVEGRVSFYVGPLLIGETPLRIVITQNLPSFTSSAEQSSRLWEETGTSPYRAIFVSYSHRDAMIVDQLELAYRALGDDYLRDISILRSGESWSPALLAKIRQANIFQLCWSFSAKKSPNVEQEWRFALGLSRSSFIRPMYWELPMPDPPEELKEIHFSFVPFNDAATSISFT